MAKKLLEAIQYAYAADRVAEKRRAQGEDFNFTTIMGIGEKSVGKTSTVREAAKAIAAHLGLTFVESPEPGPDEFGFTVADLSGDTAESLAGLFDTKDGETVVLPHKWFPRSGRGLVVIDEFNRIQSTASPILQQLADKHKFGPHTIGEGWTVVFLGNPPESASGEAYQVNDGFDESFYSRLCVLPVVIKRDDWLAYAENKGINKHVVNYVAASDQVLSSKDKKALDIHAMFPIKPSPRSLETIGNLLDGCEHAAAVFGLLDLMANEDMLVHLAKGCLGPVDANGFVRSLKIHDKPLDAVAILDNYTTPQSKEDVERTPQELIRRWSDPENLTQAQLAHITLERVIKAIAEMDYDKKGPDGKTDPQALKVKQHFEKKQLPNIDLFLQDVRQEEVVYFIRKIQQDVGPRGMELLKVLQRNNKRVLDGLKDIPT